MAKKEMNKLAWFLVPIGVAVNFIGGTIILLLKLPIYLDSIGTIIVGALCGAWPGVIVGLISIPVAKIQKIPESPNVSGIKTHFPFRGRWARSPCSSWS